MNQGYQSEFLTYVKRTGSLPNSPAARTTSRYGRPLVTASADRRAGFVEFTPAARKFPDNSPLNNECSPRKPSPNNEWEKVETSGGGSGLSTGDGGVEDTAPESRTTTSAATVEVASSQSKLGIGFPSTTFYSSRKVDTVAKMKDRDQEDTNSTVSDSTTRGGETAVSDSERRARRHSPAASLNGDDSRVRSKPASPAPNGASTSSTSSISSNNSTLAHMLRSAPARLAPPVDRHPSTNGMIVGVRPLPEETHTAGSRLSSTSVKSDNEDSHESSDKIFSNPRAPRADSKIISRPKRQIIPKNMESGLSWREENDLKKALYASLQETKHPGEERENGSASAGERVDKRRSLGSKYWLNLVVDDSSQESNRSTVSSESSSGGLLKVRAQRKFAVGSRPGSPGTTPSKSKSSPKKFFTTKKAKTEDFLTFLCLRGSHMLPPHLDFSKIDDSEDCFQTSCSNTPRSSRPSTPAVSGLNVRELTPRGGRGAPGSRSTTPDDDVSLEDNDLGVKPLPPDTTSPCTSPSKKSLIKSPLSSPSKTQLGKRKSTGKCAEEEGSEKKLRSTEKDLTTSKKDKEKRKDKKKKSHSGGKSDAKKKKKKRKEEAKMLRRKLVMRACTTAVKASKRKLKLATENAQNSQPAAPTPALAKPRQHLESISSILEGLTTVSKRGVGRPRKIGTKEDAFDRSHKEKMRVENQKPSDQSADQRLTRTRSPETRSSTRASSRSTSPYKSPSVRALNKDIERQSSGETSESQTKSSPSKKERRASSKDRHRERLKKSLLKKKVTRSETRLQESQVGTAELRVPDESAVVSSPEPIHRTRSLPQLPFTGDARSHQPQAEQQKTSTTLRRVVSSLTKSVKKAASATPAMPTPNVPEKKGRGRPPGSGKKSSNISILKMSFRAPFPSPSDPGQVVEIPTYHPSSEQFQDPISYIQSIRADAEPFGMCRIVPPDGWKPECKFPDDLKFMTQMQYIHRMRNRWGPNALALECIRRHLQSQGIKLEQAPMVGGVELDLPALSETLQHLGGMQSVIDKNKWPKVIESLRIPKLAPERCSKLYDSYCKFLLSYDTLPAEEKARLEQQVLAEKEKGQITTHDECVSKGRIRHLSDFFRHSKNIESVWFKREPSVEDVEDLYWTLVEGGEHHVAVQSAEVDTKVCGSGFPTKKDSPYSRHGWNLNILQHNSGSVLRCLGPVSGVTVPLLNVGMTFSTKCWSANDHLLPQVIYKHTGADTIWYCLPASEESKFHSVCQKLVPDHADDDPVWLLDDTVMISPEKLTENGVSLGRTTLSPGQFLFVFPEAFTASVSCGYNLSESLHFATADWIPLGSKAAQMLQDSGVPEQFSMDRLIFKLARYEKTPLETLEYVLPQLMVIVEREIRERQDLEEAGLTAAERMCLYDDDIVMTSSKKRHKYETPESEDNICDVSKKICYLSMVLNEAEDTVYSLEHALGHVQKKRNLKVCKLLYRYTIDELNTILNIVKARLAGEEPDTCRPPAKKKAAK